MTDTNTKPDKGRSLETRLDFSPIPVPLRWVEEGQIVRLCGSRISLEDIITYYQTGPVTRRAARQK